MSNLLNRKIVFYSTKKDDLTYTHLTPDKQTPGIVLPDSQEFPEEPITLYFEEQCLPNVFHDDNNDMRTYVNDYHVYLALPGNCGPIEDCVLIPARYVHNEATPAARSTFLWDEEEEPSNSRRPVQLLDAQEDLELQEAELSSQRQATNNSQGLSTTANQGDATAITEDTVPVSQESQEAALPQDLPYLSFRPNRKNFLLWRELHSIGQTFFAQGERPCEYPKNPKGDSLFIVKKPTETDSFGNISLPEIHGAWKSTQGKRTFYRRSDMMLLEKRRAMGPHREGEEGQSKVYGYTRQKKYHRQRVTTFQIVDVDESELICVNTKWQTLDLPGGKTFTRKCTWYEGGYTPGKDVMFVEFFGEPPRQPLPHASSKRRLPNYR